MADLLTHVAAGRLLAAPVRARETVFLVLVGTVLPDLASKMILVVAEGSGYAANVSHSIAGVALLSYAGALCLDEPLRRTGFAALLAGSLLHVAIDLLKKNASDGIALFFPVVHRGYELEWISPEDSLWWAPAAGLVLLFFTRRRRAR